MSGMRLFLAWFLRLLIEGRDKSEEGPYLIRRRGTDLTPEAVRAYRDALEIDTLADKNDRRRQPSNHSVG
jgi:hypothetical protein